MSTLNDNDLFVYQDADTGVVGAVANSNRSSLTDDDLFVVQRGGINYKVRSADVGGGGGDFSSVTIAPTSITPTVDEQIITCTTDIPEVNGSVPADVTWTWYLYDQATGTTGQTVLKTLTNRKKIDTITLPASASGKFIGCSVEYLAVTIDEAQRCAVGTPAGPVADMNGLRFDSTRETFLERSKAPVDKFTYSAWVKPTSDKVFRLYSAMNGANYSLLQYRGTEKTFEMLGGNQVITTTTFEHNQWYHCVMTWDGATGTIYVNGVEEASGSLDFSIMADNGDALIGKYNNGPAYSDGYMSDVYFVDGAVLEPTAFGKEFPEGWGPLDGSQVKENIANSKVQPYDTRPNYEQEWSNGTTTNENVSNPVTYMFDGDLSVFTAPPAGNNQRWTFAPSNTITVNNSLRIYIGGHGSNVPGGPVGVKIDGVEYSETPPNNQPYWKEFTGWTPGSTIEEIFGQRSASGSGGTISAIEVDGRILVDGPADNSQNWSEMCTATDPSFPASNIFNGSTSPPPTRPLVIPGSVTFTPATEITGITAVNVYRSASSASPTAKLYVNGAEAAYSGGQGKQSVSALSLTSLEFEYTSGSDYVDVYQISVTKDGAELFLVDAPAKWDTSQVWSGGFTTNGVSLTNPELSFNGDITNSPTGPTIGGTTQYIATWTPETPYPATNLRIYATGGEDAYVSYRYGVNGNTSTLLPAPGTSISTSWLDLTSLITGGQVSSIEYYNTAKGSGTSGTGTFRAVEIDGKILVDQGNFGTNGFYLPFDPAQEGVNYSSKLSLRNGATYVANQGPELAFNGSMVDSLGANLSTAIVQSGNSDLQLTFDTAINIGANSSCFMGATSGGSLLQFFNESDTNVGADISIPGGAGTLVTIPPRSDVKYIKWASNGATGGGVGFGYLIINGTLLVDHSSIGVDASGQDNHFHDQNFAVGNTDEVWSNYLTSSPDFNTNETSILAFNGDTSNAAYTSNVNTVLTFVPPQSITVNSKLEWWVSTSDNRSEPFIEINDTQLPVQVVTPMKGWLDLDFTGTINKFVFDGNGGANGVFYALKVDGKILVDKNIQDTVLDTPLFDYAVFDQAATNGNLSKTASTTRAYTTIALTANHYCEYAIQDTGSGSTIGVTGTSGSIVIEPSGAYRINGANSGTDSAISYTAGDLIGFTYDVSTGDLQVFKNGVLGKVINNALTDVKFSSTIGVDANFGQQPFVHATDNGNGTVTLVPSAAGPNMDETWSTGLSATSNGSPITVTSPELSFDSDTSTGGEAAHIGGADTVITWTPPGGSLSASSFRIYCYQPRGTAGASTYISVNGGTFVVDNGNWATVAANSNGWSDDIIIPGGELTSIALKLTYANANTLRLYAVEIDGRLYIDSPDLGPYNKLYQTWSEWVSEATRALLNAAESRVDALEQVILAMAIPWTYGSTYSAGDLVKFNCSVWRATSDGITTRTPIPTNSDIWEDLNIDCERTHSMDDLIPDNWSQEQRRAALQELLLELSEDEPESY